MDAALITAIGAVVLGLAGIVQSWRKDTTAARQTAETVATTAASQAVQSLEAALDRQDAEIKRLGSRVGALEEEKAECLERERDLALANARLETRVAELETR